MFITAGTQSPWNLLRENTEMQDAVLKRLKSAGLLSDTKLDLGTIPTGSYALNRVISGEYDKGIPVGMITQFKGNSSTGKTVFATHILREAQKKEYYTVLIDSENAYNAEFAKSLGLNPEKLIYCAPESLEACFETMESLVAEIRKQDEDTPIVIAYDSIAVSPTRDEIKAENYEMHNMMGAARAKVTGACLRRINMLLRPNKVALIVINQIREKVGVMYGNPETNAGGGRSLEYYLGVDLKCTSNKTSDVIKDDGKDIGIKGKVKNYKNKCTVPFQECEFKLFFDEGLDPYYGLTKMLETDKLITRNGAWYDCCGESFQSKNLMDKILKAESDSPFYTLKEKLGLV